MAVMSSKDFNITFIVIEKFKFSQGSLKNVCAPDFGALEGSPDQRPHPRKICIKGQFWGY